MVRELKKVPPRRSLQRYRELFELNLAGVYRTTLDGKILECNDSMARMFGYSSPRELLSRPASELYIEEADRRGFIARLKKRKVLRSCELRLRRKDGSPLDILENVSLVPDDRGKLTIIQGTMVDITDLKRLESSLRESEEHHRVLAANLRRLTHHIQSIREDERTRIARELHDDLGQTLTALKMDLHWLQSRFGGRPVAERTRIESMCSLVEATVQSIKRICSDLRPTLLDDFGLIAAIEWQIRQFESRTGIQCTIGPHPSSVRLPDEMATDVFRILQESLTNISRHARATKVIVSMKLTQRSLLLEVMDNGIGFKREHIEEMRAFGLVGMRERALRWGGKVTVTARPRRGTTVIVRMPLRRPLQEGT